MKALIVVDMQNDFMPDGALGVAGGYDIIPVINELMPAFELVVATQDWHPDDHGSFASNNPGAKVGEVRELEGLPQVMWPDHCVQGVGGSEFVPGLETRHFAAIFRKGTDPGVDSYSGFFDNARRCATGLVGYLRDKGVDAVYVCGIATDYCVQFTVLDALSEGFAAYLVEDACRGVELEEGDVARAIAKMREHGAHVVTAASLLESR